jgi:hypothetical protein
VPSPPITIHSHIIFAVSSTAVTPHCVCHKLSGTSDDVELLVPSHPIITQRTQNPCCVIDPCYSSLRLS